MQQILRRCFLWFMCLSLSTASGLACADGRIYNDKLGPGDLIHIFVYKNPDLTADFRLQEDGRVTLPLVGQLALAGKAIPEAEKTIADALVSGAFLQAPQVSVSMVTPRHKQAVVLGNVTHPGPVNLDYLDTRLSDVLAAGGGITPTGADEVVVTGARNGKSFRRVINVPAALADEGGEQNIVIASGDVLYVQRAPVFYAYGEVQKPGPYRLENNMTLQQAVITAGGLTKRASESRVRLQRRRGDGSIEELFPPITDKVQPDDVIFVKESMF
jgi:polysaccharide export outer membrane protein